MLMAAERYRRIDRLDQGNMSEVWLARDVRTNEDVALKILLTVAEDERRNRKALERFQREIKIASSLKHPHILPLLDSGWMLYNDRKVPFLVSPHMPEGSLAQTLKKRPPWQYWSLAQTADAIIQAAESLWYLHTRRPLIVHGDVKPGNFLVRTLRDPQRVERVIELFLFDFGIARLQDMSLGDMEASDIIGTLPYMSPEQVRGRVGCASDQYSLAVMACWMLTGRLPIQAATYQEYMYAHVQDPPLAPSQLNPERIFSSAIDAVILRALAKKTEQRFSTILEFAQALREAVIQQANEETSARTISVDLGEDDARYRTPSFQEVFVPVVEENFQIQLDPVELDEEGVLDEPLPGPAPKVSSTNGQREISGRLYTPLALQPVYRHDLKARPRMLCWSPQGDIVACARYGEPPLLFYRDGRVELVQEVGLSLSAHSLCWSPDGRVLALSMPGEIYFWDVVARKSLPLVLRFHTQRAIEALDWSSGSYLALWIEKQVIIYPLNADQLRVTQPSLPLTLSREEMRSGSNNVLRWSPDGKRLLAGTSDGRVLCWRMGQRVTVQLDLQIGQKVQSVSWSPDGSFYALALRDNRVIGYDRTTHEQIFQWSNLPGMPRMLSIAPNQRIAIMLSTRRLVFGFPGELAPLYSLPAQLSAVWSPTRNELATIDEASDTQLTICSE
ncbi:WD40 repeat domain-containing serine/threonine protein kinase [Ktedonospora formicarum]|uniref:Protein kinase domain-containing protein n=1 Tax=Ktedonospora formicarum TaxID=2778364 RepID=A0A8J3I2F6_9CHLR|nr:WD40 repeat domain-containing serine/threonine protein kinase [Ktedonospora formicarum]GHO45488.1 hypothetical protein KSX_36510 [Ktedonospora formicarum]